MNLESTEIQEPKVNHEYIINTFRIFCIYNLERIDVTDVTSFCVYNNI